MLFNNFLADVYKASGLGFDHRFTHWAKWVDAVDSQKDNGYAFVGQFIKDGTQEIDLSRPRAILVASVTGSRANNYTSYAVLVLNTDGSLNKTDIADNDRLRGWALRLRSPIAGLLDGLAETEPELPLAGVGDDELIDELQRRGYVVTGG